MSVRPGHGDEEQPSLTSCAGENGAALVRIEVSRTLSVPVSQAFAYITNTQKWPDYWPGFVRLDDPAGVRWRLPGDTATVVITLLNRERALNMKLIEFQNDARVTYISRQQGLPEVRHDRHWTATPEGCLYRMVVEYRPRRGLRGLFDRLIVRRSVVQALRATGQNLSDVFHRAHEGTIAPSSGARDGEDRAERTRVTRPFVVPERMIAALLGIAVLSPVLLSACPAAWASPRWLGGVTALLALSGALALYWRAGALRTRYIGLLGVALLVAAISSTC
jgi:hypothetical protein